MEPILSRVIKVVDMQNDFIPTSMKYSDIDHKVLPDVDEWLKMLKESEKEDHLKEIRECGLEYVV